MDLVPTIMLCYALTMYYRLQLHFFFAVNPNSNSIAPLAHPASQRTAEAGTQLPLGQVAAVWYYGKRHVAPHDKSAERRGITIHDPIVLHPRVTSPESRPSGFPSQAPNEKSHPEVLGIVKGRPRVRVLSGYLGTYCLRSMIDDHR